MITLDVYQTHMELYPYKKDDYPVIENMYTAIDAHTKEEKPCGYIIDEGKLYLPRGTPISKIKQITDCAVNYFDEPDEYSSMRRIHWSLYDPRDEIQEESIKFLTTSNAQASLALKTGFGKALPCRTHIPTPYGYTYMGDIKVGDEVFGVDGSPVKVTGVFPQGVLDVYEITLNDGRKVCCSEDHLWEVSLTHKPYIRSVMSLKEIMKSYKEYGFPRYFITPLSGFIQYDSNVINMLYNDEKPVTKEFIKETIQSITKDTISLPKAILYGSIDVREDACTELLELDGIEKLHHTIIIDDTKFSPIMVSNIIQLAHSMTFYAYVKGHQPKIAYIDGTTIMDIQKIGQEECQCIMVDGPRNLYLTEGFIVTHNTFCVSYSMFQLKEKTIIITPDNTLKMQWISTLMKNFELQSTELLNIDASSVIEAIMEDYLPTRNFEVFIVNHQTLHSYMTKHSGYALHQFFKKIGVGIKVYDEAHLNFINTLLIDFFSNCHHTWYVTATFGRSDKTEQSCFKTAFSCVPSYGEMESKAASRKHVIYYTCYFNSHIQPKYRSIVSPFNGMTAASYGKYAFKFDPNKCAEQTIKTILHNIQNVEGRILIFAPLIDIIENLVASLREEFPTRKIYPYHSKISASEKEYCWDNADIIVSTIKSLGTGKDIAKLRCIICAEPIASKLITEQMIGRLREYSSDKDTYFFDIVDRSIPPITWWYRSRYKKIVSLVKETKIWDLEFQNNVEFNE